MNLIPTILLVDDNKMDCFRNEKIIRDHSPSASIRIFNCPREAVEFIKSIPLDSYDGEFFLPEIIFLDINMPLLSGFDVLNELKDLDIFKKELIDVFFLSSSNSKKDINKALDQKLCKGYINKPLDKDKLTNAIKWHIKNYYTPEKMQSSRPKYVLF